MFAARSLLWLIGTLAVVAVLWLTLLTGGHGTPGTTNAPTGATSDYKTTIDSAHSEPPNRGRGDLGVICAP
jgi:hypothetical protein